MSVVVMTMQVVCYGWNFAILLRPYVKFHISENTPVDYVSLFPCIISLTSQPCQHLSRAAKGLIKA